MLFHLPKSHTYGMKPGFKCRQLVSESLCIEEFVSVRDFSISKLLELYAEKGTKNKPCCSNIEHFKI